MWCSPDRCHVALCWNCDTPVDDRIPRQRPDGGPIVRDRLGFVFGNHLREMPDAPNRAELEAAIYRHLSRQPTRETIEAVIVKVAELEPVSWPPDSKQLRAGLFLSVPFLGGDRTKLDQALAGVRKGFKRNEI